MPKTEATQMVEVKMTEDYTYRVDGSRKRTLPKGWIGSVHGNVADKIESEGKGSKTAVQVESEKPKGGRKKASGAPRKPAAPKNAPKSSDGGAKTDVTSAPAGNQAAPTPPTSDANKSDPATGAASASNAAGDESNAAGGTGAGDPGSDDGDTE